MNVFLTREFLYIISLIDQYFKWQKMPHIGNVPTMMRFLRMPIEGVVTATLFALCVCNAHAAGLGAIRSQSNLGQPFKASIALIGSDFGDLTSSCVKARIETTEGAYLTTPTAGIGSGSQGSTIYLSTRQPISEPAISVSVDIVCGSFVHRDFQLLLDPVGMSPVLAERAESTLSTSVVERASPLKSTGDETAIAPQVRRPSRAAIARLQNRSRPAAPRVVAKPAPRAVPQTPAQNVLKLSNNLTASDLATLGQLKISPTLTDQQPVTDPLRREEMRAAESRFASQLRDEEPQKNSDAQRIADREQINALLVQAARIEKRLALEQAELSELRKYALPVGWLIGLLVLLLISLIAIAWLAWRIAVLRKKSGMTPWDNSVSDLRRAQQDDLPPDAMLAGAATAPGFDQTSGATGTSRRESAFAGAAVGAVVVAAAAAEKPSPASGTGPFIPTAKASKAMAAAEAEALNSYPAKVEHLKVEEISDVMQEAEFWMSLNDPQRAIQILEPYGVDSLPDSPVPWLFLLDLYRVTDAREKYEALQIRTRNIFNARIPFWDEDGDVSDGRTLEDFPHIIDTLCELWATDQILPYLDSLIIDNRKGVREGFDLPVYQEIMLLAAMARDRSRALPRDLLKSRSTRRAGSEL